MFQGSAYAPGWRLYRLDQFEAAFRVLGKRLGVEIREAV
jgi:hypothetical protein